MSDALLIAFGWLLGLFTPRLTDALERPTKRKRLRRSLSAELEELRARLAITAVMLAMRDGSITRELVTWEAGIVRSYRGFYADKGLLETIEKAGRMTDEQLKAASGSLDKGNRGLTVKQYHAPFLAAHLESLHLFSPEFERIALEIHSRLAMLNEEIDTAWFFFAKTFAGLSAETTEKAKANVDGSYRNIARICRDLADNIGHLLDLDRNPKTPKAA